MASPAGTPTRHRVALILGLCAIVTVLFGVAFDHPDWLRRPLASAVGAYIHRRVQIAGPMTIRWSWAPIVSLNHITIANPAWDATHPLLTLRQLTVTLRLWPLLRGHIVVPEVNIDHPSLRLERAADGRANWSFRSNGRTAPSPGHRYRIGHLIIQHGRLTFLEPKAAIVVHATVSTTPSGQHIQARGLGSFRKAPFSFQFTGGSVLSLAFAHRPYPLKIMATVGSTHGRARGSISGLPALTTLQLRFAISGTDLSTLYPLFGIPLPHTASFKLHGSLQRTGRLWHLSHLHGAVGHSDIEGHLRISTARHFSIRGTLRSKHLALADLAGVTGARPQLVGNKEKIVSPTQSVHRVLPSSKFHNHKLQSANMDIEYHAAHFVSASFPLQRLGAHIRLHDGVLRFHPLHFGIADGQVAADVTVTPGHPLTLTTVATVRGVRLAKLFPKLKFRSASTGHLGGTLVLATQGTSFAAFASHATGHAGVAMAGGSVSDVLVALAQLHFGDALAHWVAGDHKEAIHCAVARLDMTRGLMQTRTFVIDTASANIFGSGTINFQNEQMRLLLRTQPKHISLISTRGPLRISGSFKKPKFKVDRKQIIERGAAAAALAAVSPLAALLPLIDTAPGRHLNCSSLLRSAGAGSRRAALDGGARPHSGGNKSAPIAPTSSKKP